MGLYGDYDFILDPCSCNPYNCDNHFSYNGGTDTDQLHHLVFSPTGPCTCGTRVPAASLHCSGGPCSFPAAAAAPLQRRSLQQLQPRSASSPAGYSPQLPIISGHSARSLGGPPTACWHFSICRARRRARRVLRRSMRGAGNGALKVGRWV